MRSAIMKKVAIISIIAFASLCLALCGCGFTEITDGEVDSGSASEDMSSDDTSSDYSTAAEKIGQIADATVAQLREYQSSISATADSFRDAAATLHTVKVEE